MKKFFIIFLSIIVIVGIGGFTYLYLNNSKEKVIPRLTIEENIVSVNEIYIYGTHLNLSGSYSEIENAQLVLYNGEFTIINIINTEDGFTLSNELNNGIYLDDIPIGEYYMFFRTSISNGEDIEYKYYAINNTTDYQETTYYTMSNYDKMIVINNEESYPTMMMHVTENKNDEVYDVVLDAGHGGKDPGATKNGYKETDFTMKLTLLVEEKLKEYGLKVKKTYEDGQLSDTEKLPEYGENGRAVIPRKVNAKYLFSMHFNSSEASYVSGLEVYTAKGINYTLARTLVSNLDTIAGLEYSNNRINKVENGIYSRNFTEEQIEESKNENIEEGKLPYDITTKSCYYYIIRETGGIVTGAYVDGRNSDIPANPYYDSNVGTEAYLMELGYLSNTSDLDNLINNIDKYAEAIAVSIKTIYDDIEVTTE